MTKEEANMTSTRRKVKIGNGKLWMSKLWIAFPETEILCDTCIYEDDTGCCTADDCFGGDHYDNQLSLFGPETE